MADDEISAQIKMCNCEIADIIYDCEKASQYGRGIKSISAGEQSITFDSDYSNTANLQRDINCAINLYLGCTGLLDCVLRWHK